MTCAHCEGEADFWGDDPTGPWELEAAVERLGREKDELRALLVEWFAFEPGWDLVTPLQRRTKEALDRIRAEGGE